MKQRCLIFCLALAFLATPLAVSGEMSSASYEIYADNVESGGGLLSGGEYVLESSVGESPIGVSTGGVYEIRAGYQYMERGGLSMSVNPSSVNLGELSASAVSQGSVTVMVSTDSDSGYSLSVSSVSGTSLTAVSDGAVSAGSEEYGVAGSGTDNQITGDVAVTNGLSVAYSAIAVSGNDTTLTFKASISGSSVSGSYSQNIILTALSNF